MVWYGASFSSSKVCMEIGMCIIRAKAGAMYSATGLIMDTGILSNLVKQSLRTVFIILVLLHGLFVVA